MSFSQSGQDIVECPYDESHRMMRKRLQSHLHKCRLNFPDVELKACPFNQTHLVPQPEFTLHVEKCPDRKLITQYKCEVPLPQEEECVRHEPIECEENWDDTDVNDYNPQRYMDKANVLRRSDDKKPSESRTFKKECKYMRDGSSRESEQDQILVPLISEKFEERHDDIYDKIDRRRSYNILPPPVPRNIDWHGTNNANSELSAPTDIDSSHCGSYRERSPLRRSPEYERFPPSAHTLERRRDRFPNVSHVDKNRFNNSGSTSSFSKDSRTANPLYDNDRYYEGPTQSYEDPFGSLSKAYSYNSSRGRKRYRGNSHPNANFTRREYY